MLLRQDPHTYSLRILSRLTWHQLQCRITNTGVHNLSSRVLSPEEGTVLGLGLNFVPKPPPPLPEPVLEDFHTFFRTIRLRYFFKDSTSKASSFRVPNPSWEPPHTPSSILQECRSLSTELKDWLHRIPFPPLSRLPAKLWRALNTLAHDSSIVIKQADKNLGITLLDASHYNSECLRHLLDTNTYRPAAPDIQDILHNLELIKVKHGARLPYSLWRYFFAGSTQVSPAAFYVILKVHKDPPVGRPIAASHSWVTVNVSRWLTAQLQPIAEKQATYLRDSEALVVELEDLEVPKEVWLATYDVAALYPSISLSFALRSIHHRLREANHPLTDVIMPLLEWVMYNSYVEYDGKVYHQIKGTAMGTPVAPAFATLFMAEVDDLVGMTSAQAPRLHRRFLDDGFILWVGAREGLVSYFHHFNNAVDDIQVTYNISDQSVDFLDISIFKGKRFNTTQRLDFRTYQKPLNLYLYLPYSSFHPRACKIGFIGSEIRRHILRCSRVTDFLALRRAFYHRLRARGYPPSFLLPIFNAPQHQWATRSDLLTKAKLRVASSNNDDIPTRRPQVLKCLWTTRSQQLRLGFFLRHFRNRLSKLFPEVFTCRFVVAWRLPRKFKHFLVRAKSRVPLRP